MSSPIACIASEWRSTPRHGQGWLKPTRVEDSCPPSCQRRVLLLDLFNPFAVVEPPQRVPEAHALQERLRLAVRFRREAMAARRQRKGPIGARPRAHEKEALVR